MAAMADRTAARREEARIKALDRAGKLALIAAGGKGIPRVPDGRTGRARRFRA